MTRYDCRGDPDDTLMTRYDCRGPGRYADGKVRLQGDPDDTLMTRYQRIVRAPLQSYVLDMRLHGTRTIR